MNSAQRFKLNVLAHNRAQWLMRNEGTYWSRHDGRGWLKGPSPWESTDRYVYKIRSAEEHCAATAPPEPEYRDYTIDEVPCGKDVSWATFDGNGHFFHGPVTICNGAASGEFWLALGRGQFTAQDAREHATWDDTGLPLGVEVTR